MTAFLLCLLIILLHEAGHLFAILSLGLKIKSIGLKWLGLYIRQEESTPLNNVVILLAGPGFNLLLALIFWCLWPTFGLCNLVFGGVNLLPIPHSDGKQAWQQWQARKAEKRRAGEQIMRRILGN